MRDHKARIRTGLTPAPTTSAVLDTRVHVDLDHLRSLEARAKTLTFLPRQPANSVLNGRHSSRLRGRGLNFEELSDYHPGDDVRAIDWKVTARTGKPHVRIYTEERDRPALIVVDQRMSMFFGTKLNMKSVTAAEVAALAAFRILDQGDRVGGLVVTDQDVKEVRPSRSRHGLTSFLTALAKANCSLRANSPAIAPLPFNHVLKSVARIAKRDHLIVLLSDFDEVDSTTEVLIGGLSRHNDVVLGIITDPVAQTFPDSGPLVISDGERQAELDSSQAKLRDQLQDMSTGRLAQVYDWQRKFGLPVLPLTAAQDSLPQMRALMGLGPRRRG